MIDHALDRPVGLTLRRTVLTLALGLAWVGCAGANPNPAAGPDAPSAAPHTTQQAPPPPARVPPNASRVSAKVLEVKEWPPGSLQEVAPSAAGPETLYSLEIRLLSAEPVSEELDNLAVPGHQLEAFSDEKPADDLVGKTITATLEMRGSTRGVRWYVREIEIEEQGEIERSARRAPAPDFGD